MATVVIEDFSGGLTDYPMNAGKNKCKRLDNIVLRQYEGGGKPSTRPGSDFLLKNNPQLPSGNGRISTIFEHEGRIFCQSEKRLFYAYDGAWVEVDGIRTAPFPESTVSSNFSTSKWGDHLLVTHSPHAKPSKLYFNDQGLPRVATAGLPTPTLLSYPPQSAAGDRLFKVVFSYKYKTFGGIEFEDVSQPTLPLFGGGNGASYSLSVKKLNSDLNYPQTISVKVYSTSDNGTTYYLAAEGIISTFQDSSIVVPYIPDDILKTKEVLYTDGGILPNTEPPRANCLHVVDEVAYYGDVIDTRTGVRHRNRVMASIPSDIDSVPETFYVDLDGELAAISSTKSTVVALCKKGAYRLNNTQNEIGQGSILFEKISDTSTCISSSSAVQTLYGIFWAGYDGIFYSDGYSVKKLNQEYDKTYKQWTLTPDGQVDEIKAQKVQGKYNQSNDTIAWTFQTGVEDSDTLYVLDLKYGIRENSSFTTWSGGDSFRPTAIEFSAGNLIRGDMRGFVFQHKDSISTDLRVNMNTLPSLWTTQAILYDISTIDYDFGTGATRKYVTEVTVACSSDSNLSLQITSNSDMGRKVEELRPVRSKSSHLWGSDALYWGDSDYFWNIGSSVHQRRKMPGRSIRCNYKSLSFTNAKVALLSSDEIGAAMADSYFKTLTLLEEGREFPASFIGHFIAFESDNYTQEFEILSISNSKNQLTLSDPLNNILPSPSTLWVLRGYPKGEVLNLLNVIVTYEPFGITQAAYRASQSGEVG